MPKKPTYDELLQRVHELESSSVDLKNATPLSEENEQIYKHCFENANVGVCLVEPDGNFIIVNNRMVEIFGYSKKEFEGMNVDDVSFPEDIAISKEVQRRVKVGEVEHAVFQKRYIHKKGHMFWGKVSNSIVKDHDGKPLYFVTHFIDITESKKTLKDLQEHQNELESLANKRTKELYEANLALQESERQFRQLFENMSSGVAVYEPTEDGKNFIFKNVNKAAEKIDQISRNKLAGKNVKEVFPGITESGLFDVFKRVWQTGEPEKHPFLLYKDHRLQGWRSSYVYKLPTGEIVSIFDDITERKQMEMALRESEERYSLLIQNSQTGIYIHVDGVLKFVNNYFAKMLGYEPEKMIGRLYWDFVHPGDRKMVKEISLARTRGEDAPPEYEFRHQSKDGGIVWVHNLPIIIQYQGQTANMGNLIQINERKRAEDALKENENKLKNIIENSTNLFYSHSADHEITFVSPQVREVLGYEPEEVMLRWTELTTDNPINEKGFKLTEKAIKTGKRQPVYQLELERKDGKKIIVEVREAPVTENGRVVSIVGSLADITERKQAEIALRESEEQFRHFFDHLTIGVAVYEAVEDGKDFVFVDMNQAGQELSNISIDEIRGERLTQFFPGVKDLGLLNALQNTWRTGQSTHVPYSTYKDERITQWVENRVFRLPSGKIVAIYDDRTELMRLEEGLRQAQKMESIGNLAGGIAHDFNNILSSIIGFTELALDETSKGTLLEDSLQEVYSAGKRAKDLVKQILAFARQSDEKISPIQPRVIVKEVLNFIRSTIPTTIKIQENIKSESLILGNATQVHQVLMNLCTNAAYAMEDSGGTLNLSLQDVFLDKEKLSIGMKPGDYIKVEVSDTGTGIDPEIIDSIFEPYFTTKADGEGTGIGLAMVQGVVESYGGKITVDSQLGKGTTFTIYLPITKKRLDHDAYVPEQLPGGTESILFVDDEAPIAKMGSQILERLGYMVTTRTSSIEALELFRARPNDFDLVVTDMTMPNLTGDKLAIELMKIRPDISVILCTGYSKKISDETALEIGIKAFAYKPVVKADLAKTVRKVLDEAKRSSHD